MPKVTLGACAILLWTCATLSAREVDERKLAVKITDIVQTRTFLGVDPYERFRPALGSVKIAVLDKGFKGIHPAREDGRLYLPANTRVISEYPDAEVDIPLDPEDPHGTHMAHVAWAVTGYQEDGPIFRLYNANGPENFLLAVEEILRWKPHIVIFSQNWEMYGNFDGTGFIDAAVRRVTDAGIIWLNAAGNDGGNVYNGPVNLKRTENGDYFVDFGTKPNPWYVRFKNRVDENRVVITLSWHFDPGSEPVGTDKDLNLSLFVEEPGKAPVRIATSRLKQTMEKTGDAAESIHSRERIAVTLPASDNHYLLAVNAADEETAKLFTQKDRLRITIRGDQGSFYDEKAEERVAALDFLDASKDGELPVPADGSGLTIGDLSENSSRGPTVDGRGKPEIVMQKNNVTFNDGNGFFGTSYATAYFAGIVALLVAAEPELTQRDLLRFRVRYPLQYLAELVAPEGWQIAENPVIDPLLAEYIQSVWGVDYLVFHAPDGRTAVASSESVAKIHAWGKTVMDNLDDYYLYLRVKRTPTTKTVQVPEQREVVVRAGYYKPKFRRKLEKYVVRPAYYEDRTRYDTYNVGGSFDTIDLLTGQRYTNQLQLKVPYTDRRLVPAEYDYRWVNVPDGQEWVEPEKEMRTFHVNKQVPGEPRVEKIVYSQPRKDAKPPWEKWGGSPLEYVEIVQLPSFNFQREGKITDGSASDPRIGETPPYTSLGSRR